MAMAAREATPPPVIGKAGRYTVFITPPATPSPSDSSRSRTPSPTLSPRPSPGPSPRPKNAPSELSRSYSSSPKTKTIPVPSPPPVVQTPPPVQAPPPPVQVPPPQFAKSGGKSTGSGVFGFFWDAIAKVQDAHSSLDEYLADWLGLNQSRYQWALNDYYENNAVGKDGDEPKEVVSKGQAV